MSVVSNRVRKKTLITLVAIACLALLYVAVPTFIRARNTKAMSACVNHLRLIESAKQQLALENPAGPNPPTWDTIILYVGRDGVEKPVCPDGGTYTIGRFNELPTCSLGQSRMGHSLPP